MFPTSAAASVVCLVNKPRRPMQVAHQAPVVQKVDNTIHWINLYLVDRAIGFAKTSSGY